MLVEFHEAISRYPERALKRRVLEEMTRPRVPAGAIKPAPLGSSAGMPRSPDPVRA